MAEYRAILEQQTELAERILDEQTRLMQASLAAGRNVSANSTQVMGASCCVHIIRTEKFTSPTQAAVSGVC